VKVFPLSVLTACRRVAFSRRDAAHDLPFAGARAARRAAGERGLSAVEILVACGAVIALAAMILPATRQARGFFLLASATDQVVSNLEHARSEAVKRDGAATVTFNSSDTYTIQYAGLSVTHSLPGGVSFALPGGAASLSVQYYSSGKTVVTPAGNIVLQSAFGQRTLRVSVAGNINRT
jgi:type II secretory pathway pseudopilin PulG